MVKSIVSILIIVLGFTSLAYAASEVRPDGNTDAQLQDIYASGLAVSADLVLPANFVTSRSILQDIYASGLAVSADLVLPADFVTSRSILQDIYASGLAVSADLTISN